VHAAEVLFEVKFASKLAAADGTRGGAKVHRKMLLERVQVSEALIADGARGFAEVRGKMALARAPVQKAPIAHAARKHSVPLDHVQATRVGCDNHRLCEQAHTFNYRTPFLLYIHQGVFGLKVNNYLFHFLKCPVVHVCILFGGGIFTRQHGKPLHKSVIFSLTRFAKSSLTLNVFCSKSGNAMHVPQMSFHVTLSTQNVSANITFRGPEMYSHVLLT
jgi:hypothetical protein